MSSVNLYGCGGAGVGLVRNFLKLDKEDQMPDLRILALDTSDANLRTRSGFNDDDIYLIPGVDGSGKYRVKNFDPIGEHVPSIMLKMKPADYNIVVYSTGGGSGSVLGPMIVHEMAKNNIPVISVMIGCGGNKVEAVNNLNTIMTLEGMSCDLNTNMAACYIDKTEMTAQDGQAMKSIGLLLKLFSGKFEALDTEDITNWLYHKVHSNMSDRLNLLKICLSEEDVRGVDTPISVASLHASREDPHFDLKSFYHTHGYGFQSDKTNQMHYCLTEKETDRIIDRCKKEVQEYEEIERASIRSRPDVQPNKAKGFVL